jgi:multidrug efflux pump subunit AcrA (membrane-fusion protein)
MGNLQTLKLEYEEYLRNQRGLSERSIYHCWRFADRFLAFRFKGKDSARGISDLDQAELNLRYCQIAAEIDGVIARRNVNPGNNVLAGQDLMAIRSLRGVCQARAKLLGQSPCRDPHSVSCSNGNTAHGGRNTRSCPTARILLQERKATMYLT